MTPEKIRKIVDELRVSDEGERPRLQATRTNDPRLMILAGNNKGLLALARKLMIAATGHASELTNRELVSMEDDDLWVIDGPNNVAISYIELRDVLPPSPEEIAQQRKEAWRNDRGFLIGCSLVGFVALFLLISGVILWIGIWSGNPRFMP